MNIAAKARFAVKAIVILACMNCVQPAHATFTLVGFEDANVPNNPGPNTTDISNTFADAYPGDSVNGIIFSDDFSVFRNTYTTNVGGTDFYGPTNGSLALTNTAGGGTADTGPNDAGIDGLTITTDQTLESVDFAPNDYGNGSFGADQVTVTAYGSSGDLASDTLSLVDGFGDPITTLQPLDTSGAFDPFAGQITGYRINRELSPDYSTLGSGGGNYVADDFLFSSVPSVPEPSPAACYGVGLLALTGMILIRRRATSAK